MISPFRADSYGIEFLRSRLNGKVTTDKDSDNDTSILNVEPDFAVITGDFLI
jgi:hypothetical protein